MNKKEKILNFHKTYWKQRAKIKHIKLADTNAGYFHKITSGRRNRKIIREIRIPEGTQVIGDENIRNEIRNDFKKDSRKKQ